MLGLLLPRDGGILSTVRRFFFLLSLLYPVLIAIMSTSFAQRHLTFQHALRFPLFAKYDTPEKYGLAPGKTLNLNLMTTDNTTIGAWFMLSEPFYQQLRRSSSPPSGPPSRKVIREAIASRPTVLFLHGAAGTRAQGWRVQAYQAWTSRLRANVLAIDYRGFGDSTGVPSEDGLVTDAYTAWTWLKDNAANDEDILIVGHSLGTGVSAQLAKKLAAEDAKPRGVALLAPFSGLSTLIESYDWFGIPVLQPLQNFHFGRLLLKRLLRHEFDTLSVIQDFNAPTLIAHARDDYAIPHAHSHTLVDRLLEPLLPEVPVQLPTAPGKAFSSEDFAAFTKAQKERREARTALVRKTEVPNFGTMEEFQGHKAPRVMYIEAFWGSHDRVGLHEGMQDEMAKFFKLL